MKRYKFTISRIQTQTHDFIILGDDLSHIDSQSIWDKAWALVYNSNWRNFSDVNTDYQIDHLEEVIK
jgi:hypothetical protein